MTSSLVADNKGKSRPEEETDKESRSAVGLKINAETKMALRPLLLDHIDENSPRSSWFSDSVDLCAYVFEPLESSALITLSNTVVGKAGLLFHGERKPSNPKSGFIPIQMLNFNHFEFMAHHRL
ncbi:uncharacterized protein CYBJADRAFT_174858 [Cyberlindnera jadinii NRRL Y-1542]|uniref:Uncharacterized protein n=1 Tax=Cyberlindnera jadinii (strain ATCC 18201 / CBS 1600 / BCRC 20928 / JCM 3617 / NBRC 0987 / NRRL Y-1542) TaxID=983966 RepID=A0A1E4RWC8_CYBJN|nr:hypothetical protein CYBJADRAFT_174858 [Cyberlindnera jadinii NRRL Y-1542]ODV71568.1 hypothetical protein CYBJADRAFT_174858 [Cyberlindnera jadinii NRRL Y-1542]